MFVLVGAFRSEGAMFFIVVNFSSHSSYISCPPVAPSVERLFCHVAVVMVFYSFPFAHLKTSFCVLVSVAVISQPVSHAERLGISRVPFYLFPVCSSAGFLRFIYRFPCLPLWPFPSLLNFISVAACKTSLVFASLASILVG